MKQDIRPQELAARMKAGEAFRIVDVRTGAEYASGHIPGSANVPARRLRTEIAGLAKEGSLVIVCQSGVRSRFACKRIAEVHPGVLNMVGGLSAWRAAGLGIEVAPKSSRSLDRQTHLVAGLLLLTAFGLAEFVGPRWIYLALLPAFGLLLDPVTGICPMTLILKKMPWNYPLR